jgi:hypothetical protein
MKPKDVVSSFLPEHSSKRDQVMQLFLRLLFSLLFIAAAGVPVRSQQHKKETGPVRIALISTEKSETLLKLLTVAEAKLSELPDVEVLERSAINRVLAEHKLTLSGFVAADQAVSVGKLLAVDLFAVLDAGANAKEIGGLVIFDAHTGVLLWDAALPGDNLDAAVRGMVEAVSAAQRKHRTPKKLRPVCVLTVRNVDLPRDMDAFCDSVGLLLERQLAASPDLAVLERRRLHQVNRERDLPTNSPLRQLLASVITLELEVGRSSDKDRLRATVLLSDGQGKSLGKSTVAVSKRDAVALSAALLRATAQALDAKLSPAEPERKREAARFLREADFYWGHKDPLRALPAVESSFALSPDDPSLRVAVAYGLLFAANEVLDPGEKRGVGSFVHKADPSTLERSLALAHDGSERLLEVESLPASIRLTPAGNVHKMFAEAQLHNYLVHHVDGLTDGVAPEARTAIEDIHATQRRLYGIRMQRIEAAVHDPSTFEEYTNQFNHSFFFILNNRLPAEKWVQTQEELRRWVALARKFPDARSANSRTLFAYILMQYRYPPRLNEQQAARLLKLWTEIGEQANPILAVYSRLGILATEVSFAKLSDSQSREKIHAYRLFVQEQLEKADRSPDPFRLTLYLAAYDSIDQLRNRPGYGEELKELNEFMLKRKELASTIAGLTAFHFHSRRTPEGYRYAYDVLRRALLIVDGKEGRLLSYATTPALLRHETDILRRDYRSRQAEIAQADPAAVSGLLVSLPKAQTLIDVYPNKEGLIWFYQPVVDAGTVNVAAIEMSGSPPRSFALLVRLSTGKDGKWESRKVEVPFRNQPWLQSGNKQLRMNGPYFGTAACVYQDRYYLGTRGLGIFVFPFDGGEVERITTADGLPSDFVQGLDCFDGKLYAYLGEPDTLDSKDSYFIAWDIHARQCEVLASSRRKEKRSPFDDNKPLLSTFFRADPKRKQILFAAHAQHPLNGLWSFDVKTKKFHRLFILHNGDVGLMGPSVRIEGDLLRMPTHMGVFDYDLAKNDGHLIYDGKVRLEVGPLRSAVYGVQRNPAYRRWTDNSWNASGQFALAGGWLWAAKPFSRRALTGGAPELLASLRPDMKLFQPTEVLQKYDDDRLLVGDSFGMWLVPLSKPKIEKNRDR